MQAWLGLQGNGSNDERYLKFINRHFLLSFIWNLSLRQIIFIYLFIIWTGLKQNVSRLLLPPKRNMYNQQIVLVISQSFFPNDYHFPYDIVNGKTKISSQLKESKPDDDRIASPDAPRFMLNYHCVRDNYQVIDQYSSARA